MTIPRKAKIAIIFVAVVAGGYLLVRLGFSSNGVPADFANARLQGALISQNIVDLSNQIVSELEKVNGLDKERNYEDALNLTQGLLDKSTEVRNQAVQLSGELSKMTSSLSTIKSQDARAAALESIADRLALINKLINYSDYLAQLLTQLQAKFAGVKGDHRIDNLITQVNAEVTAINNFNRQATQAMDKFDNITK